MCDCDERYTKCSTWRALEKGRLVSSSSWRNACISIQHTWGWPEAYIYIYIYIYYFWQGIYHAKSATGTELNCCQFRPPYSIHISKPPLFGVQMTTSGYLHDIYIFGVYTVFLAGKSPNIRSYTVYIYSSCQP